MRSWGLFPSIAFLSTECIFLRLCISYCMLHFVCDMLKESPFSQSLNIYLENSHLTEVSLWSSQNWCKPCKGKTRVALLLGHSHYSYSVVFWGSYLNVRILLSFLYPVWRRTPKFPRTVQPPIFPFCSKSWNSCSLLGLRSLSLSTCRPGLNQEPMADHHIHFWVLCSAPSSSILCLPVVEQPQAPSFASTTQWEPL